MMHKRLMVAAGALAVLAACSGPQVADQGPGMRPAENGKVLVDAQGMTLYTYDEDSGGTPTCTGACAIAWPPAEAQAASAHPQAGFSLVRRPDGTMQWAYQGHPLYAYFRDGKPGEMNGDGAEGVWHVARL